MSYQFTAVATAGQAAPGTGGKTFGDFSKLQGPPVATLGNDGRVAFAAVLEDGGAQFGSGCWVAAGGTSTLVAMTGQKAPGTADTFNAMEFPVLAVDGRVLLYGLTSSQATGVWSWADGSLSAVAVTGQQAPGMPSGVTFGQSQSSPAFNYPPPISADGTGAFLGFLNGQTADKDQGLWTGGLPPVGFVFQSGTPSPVLPDGTIVDSYITGPVMNTKGVLTFAATANQAQSSGIFSGDASGLTAVVRQGDPAPGTSSKFNALQGHWPAVNDPGNLAFQASTPDALGIWANTVGKLELVALGGQAAPGFSDSGWIFFGGGFFDPLLAGGGRVVFYGVAQKPGTPEPQTANGLWSWTSPYGLHPVAIGGREAPGTGGLKYLPGFVQTVAPDRTGNLMFSGLVGPQEQTGIWLEYGATPELKVLEGNSLVVDGVSKTVTSLTPPPSGGAQNGLARAFNDNGQFVFVAGFSDGTSSVVLASPG